MATATITNGEYTQGDLSFPVDMNDIPKTLDAVGKLSNGVLANLAKANNLPTEPFDKRLITLVLKSHVQNVWYQAIQGAVPQAVNDGHIKRVNAYVAQLAILSDASTDDFVTVRKVRAENPAAPKLMYVLDQAKYEANWKDWRGQKYIVVKSMLDLGVGISGEGTKTVTGATIRQIADDCKETRETKAPTKNATGLIINTLRKAGIVILLNPQDEREKKPRAPKATTTPAVAAPVKTKAPAPAAHSKK